MSKVKLFDKNIFLEDLRQLRTVNVICGVILLLEALLVPLYAFIVRPDPDQVYYSSTNTVPLYAVGPLVLCVALAMPVMTNILFDFIDKRNSSDFYHSLPVRRETMYITHIAAVLLSCLALFIIPSAVEYVLFLPLSYMKITLGDFGYVLADVMVLGMLLASVLVVAKCLCGTRFGEMAVFTMILFLPRCYLLFIRTCIESFYPYVLLTRNNSIFWNQNWNLLFGVVSDYENVGSIVYTFILSLLYFVLGGVLFVKRKSEKAESVAVNKHVQLLFRVLPALTFSFLPLLFLIESLHEEYMSAWLLTVLFILYVVAVVIYFLYELLTTRKLKSVVKAAPGLIFLLAGNLLIYGIIEGYGHYQSNIIPDANQITSVEFIENGNSYNSQIGIISYPSGYYFDNLIGEVEFTDDEFISMIAEKLEQTLDEVKYGGYYSCNDVCVKIKFDGGTIYRRLYIDDDDWDMFVYNIIESDEYFAAADMLPDFDSKDHSYSNTELCYDVGYYSTSVDLENADFLKIYESYKSELASIYRHKQYTLAVSEYQGKPFISFTLDSNYIMRLAVDEELMPETYSLVEKYLNITYPEDDPDEEV